MGTVAGGVVGGLFGPGGAMVGAQIGKGIFTGDIKATASDVLSSLIDYAKAGVAKIAGAGRPYATHGAPAPYGTTRMPFGARTGARLSLAGLR